MIRKEMEIASTPDHGFLSTTQFNFSEEMVISASFQYIPYLLILISKNPLDRRVGRRDQYIGRKEGNFNIASQF